ncbi:MAG: calcium-binding protein, partial [Rhodoluna sp.]
MDWAIIKVVDSLQLQGGGAVIREALKKSDATNVAALQVDIKVAQDYIRYLENPDMINAVIAAAPDSQFAAGWALTLLRAKELGLDALGRATDGADSLVGDDQDEHLRGLGGSDVIDGGLGDDFLDGGAGDDHLTGGAGNDTLKGAGGVDTLIGGAGDDTYIIDATNDVVTEYANEGADTIVTTRSQFALIDNIENLTYTGSGAFTGTGNGLDNVIAGGSGSDIIDGAAGNDTYRVQGSQDRSRVLRFGGNWIVAQNGQGVDKLANIEKLVDDGGDLKVFDNALQYVASHADLISTVGANSQAAYNHFLNNGVAENRKITFSGLAYIASYDDLRLSFGADGEAGARHYIELGRGQGRSIVFDSQAYIYKYADVQATYGNDLEAAARHFIMTGAALGRNSSLAGN